MNGKQNIVLAIVWSAVGAFRRGFAQAFLWLLMLGMLFAPAPAQAALSTNITNIVDDLTTFFGSIQTLVISVVVFGLAIGYAKLLRRK
jgi:Na+/pantothenate symporter